MQLELPDWDVDRMMEVQLENLKGIVQGYFRDDTMPQDVIEDYGGLVHGLGEALMNIKAKELDQTGDDTAALEMRLRFLREAAKTDRIRHKDVAELLVEVAEGQMERDDRVDALDSLDEAIEILQRYGKEHNDKAALERAEEIRELKQSYEET